VTKPKISKLKEVTLMLKGNKKNINPKVGFLNLAISRVFINMGAFFFYPWTGPSNSFSGK